MAAETPMMTRRDDSWEERVREVMSEARRRLGTAERLAQALEEAGVRSPKTGLRYSAKVVQAWARGDVTPDAMVLMATLQVARIPLERVGLVHAFDGRLREMEQRLADVEERIQGLLHEQR
jgi:hypothetical protein